MSGLLSQFRLTSSRDFRLSTLLSAVFIVFLNAAAPSAYAQKTFCPKGEKCPPEPPGNLIFPPGFYTPPGLKAFSAPITYPSCSDWPSCDDNPAPATELSAVTGYETFTLDSETDHFTFWTDPTDPNTANYDPTEMQVVQDQMECAYRYFVCHLGMTPPRDIYGYNGTPPDPLVPVFTYDKRKVFIGDHPSFANAQYIALGDFLVTGNGAHKLYTTPVHEFFHHLNKSPLAYTGSVLEVISEGLATLAEQMVSYENLEKSFQDILRSDYLRNPHDPATYSHAMLFRYLGEQVTGPPNQYNEVDQDFGVDDIIEQLVLATTTASTPISEILETVFNDNVSPSSHVQTFEQFMDNFVTTLAGFQYVNPFRQPTYYFHHDVLLTNAVPTGLGAWTNSTSLLAPGDSMTWDNTGSYHGPSPGFYQFLQPEFHRIEIDRTMVNGLRFRNTGSDDDIRYQFIVRLDNGNVFRRVILEGTDFEEFRFATGNFTVVENWVAVYSVAPTFPPISPSGQLYQLEVEAF